MFTQKQPSTLPAKPALGDRPGTGQSKQVEKLERTMNNPALTNFSGVLHAENSESAERDEPMTLPADPEQTTPPRAEPVQFHPVTGRELLNRVENLPRPKLTFTNLPDMPFGGARALREQAALTQSPRDLEPPPRTDPYAELSPPERLLRMVEDADKAGKVFRFDKI